MDKQQREVSQGSAQRYPIYKVMTAKGNLVASAYKETSSLALGLQTSSLATNLWYLKES